MFDRGKAGCSARSFFRVIDLRQPKAVNVVPIRSTRSTFESLGWLRPKTENAGALPLRAISKVSVAIRTLASAFNSDLVAIESVPEMLLPFDAPISNC